MRVAAANQQGAGPYSDTSSFVETLPGAPNAPAAPTVSEIGSGSVKVTWSAPDPYTGATPIVQYDLQVFDGSAWHESRPEAGQGTGLTINGYLLGGGGGSRDLEPSTDYQVRVRARNGILDGDGNVTGHRLGIWSEATAFRTAPGAPTGLIAIPQDGGAWLLWTPPAASGPGDVSHYTVEYADNAAFTGSQTVDSVSLAAGERVVPLDWALLPSGLETGDRFRLLFVSTQPTGGDDGPIGSAEASDIAVYNDFAQRRAAAGHAAIAPYADGFRALVTTTGINAVVNTGTTWSNSDRGVAIYWLNGDKAADDYGDFYDDSWDSNAPKNESGGDSTFHDRVWTGSTHSGGRVFGQEAGQDSVSYGNPTSSGGELRASTATTGGLTRGTIYGLSPVLVVGPEGASGDRRDGPDQRRRDPLPGAGGAPLGRDGLPRRLVRVRQGDAIGRGGLRRRRRRPDRDSEPGAAERRALGHAGPGRGGGGPRAGLPRRLPRPPGGDGLPAGGGRHRRLPRLRAGGRPGLRDLGLVQPLLERGRGLAAHRQPGQRRRPGRLRRGVRRQRGGPSPTCTSTGAPTTWRACSTASATAAWCATWGCRAPT